MSGSGVSVTSEASSVTKRNDPDSSSGDTDETIEDTNNKVREKLEKYFTTLSYICHLSVKYDS